MDSLRLPRILAAEEVADMSALPPGVDVLFAGPSNSLSPGELREMQEVLHAGERHGAVCPRMAMPGYCTSFPLLATEGDGHLDAETAVRAHARLAPLLPRYSVIPAAQHWPVLVRGDLIRRFGGPAPGIASPLAATLHWSRYGYSTVVAHRVLVHPGFGKTAAPAECAMPNEQEPRVRHYLEREVHPLERFAPLFGAASPRRRRLLFSFMALRPVFDGTSEYGLALLRELQARHAESLELTVLARPDAVRFHNLQSQFPHVVVPGDPLGTFDLGFSPCHFLDGEQLVLLDRHCLRMAFTILDLIWIRCGQLIVRKPAVLDRLHLGVQMADGVMTISEAVHADVEAYFPGYFNAGGPILRTIPLGLTDQEATPSPLAARGGPILVVGNHYAHKALPETLAAISGVNRPVIVLGGKDNGAERPPHVTVFPSGKMPQEQVDALYQTCSVLVFPSQYEGFGLPVARVLAMGKPVVLFPSDTNREVVERFAVRPDQAIFCDTFAGLPDAVAKALSAEGVAAPALPMKPRTWAAVADDTVRFFDEVLARPCDADRLRRRHDAAQGLGAILAAEQLAARARPSFGGCAGCAGFRAILARVAQLFLRRRPMKTGL